MSDPIYRGEAILLNWNDNKSGRKIVLQIEKDAPGAHPFDGLDGEFVNEDVGGWSDEFEMWDCPFRRYTLSWFTHWQPLPPPPEKSE